MAKRINLHTIKKNKKGPTDKKRHFSNLVNKEQEKGVQAATAQNCWVIP